MKLTILFFLFFYSCNTSVEENKTSNNSVKTEIIQADTFTEAVFAEDTIVQEIDTILYEIKLSPKGNYYTVKNNIQKKQLAYKKNLRLAKTEEKKDSIIKEAGQFIDEFLLNKIIPFWYGTEWDFSGYTHKPNNGFVGCSYFVSTTLKHSGFNLNRYHLAQQNPENEAKSLQTKGSITEFYYSEGLIKKLENLEKGLYFVGLDSHVGYLLIRKKKAFFINSNYMSPLCVEIQYAETYPVFESNIYFIVAIGNNKSLIKKWILGEEIAIVKRKK